MRLRKMLHSKARPVRDTFFVNTVDGKQYRVVGRSTRQPQIGDTFDCVLSSHRNARIGRRTYRVVDISNAEVPLYTLEYVSVSA